MIPFQYGPRICLGKQLAVYEAKAVRGLLSIAKEGYFQAGSKILLMHLGGSPAIHAYANQFGAPKLKQFPC